MYLMILQIPHHYRIPTQLFCSPSFAAARNSAQQVRARSAVREYPKKAPSLSKKGKRNKDGSERRLGPGEDVRSRGYEEAEKKSEYGFWDNQIKGDKDGKYKGQHGEGCYAAAACFSARTSIFSPSGPLKV